MITCGSERVKSTVDRIRKCDEKGTLNTESIPCFEVRHVEELSAILFILFGYQNLFHFRTKTISYFFMG